jgi:tungstate transport system permease protein
MGDGGTAFGAAVGLIASGDPEFLAIVGLSLRVTLSAVAIACLIGMPLGALLAVGRFPGRGAAVVAVNALMGLPPVVVGLTVYLMLSRSGPLGALGLLYTPSAMIAAQVILVAPIVAALTRQAVSDLNAEYDEYLRSLGASRIQTVGTLLWDARFSLATAALAGFGRASAEVGAVMIVGGNIAHVTRVMTTAIALETSRGELALALGLGIVLLAISLAVNAAVMAVRERAEAVGHA